ncbi:hypothetical protein [Paenibacillus crassostreae]|nr:hypothetical protein [Paenibacillus crassostreae]
MKDKINMVEVWGDVVELKSLVLAIMIASVSTMGAYFLAPGDNRTSQLLFGLAGAVIGFIISTVLIKPKRILTLEENQEEDKQDRG